MMKKLICIAALAVASFGVACAQDYNWGVGMRLGGDQGGLSVRYKLSPNDAIEGLFGSYWTHGAAVSALYERFVPLRRGRELSFYYGAGGHVGERKREFVLGADGIAGLEYLFRDVPIALSFDWKPSLHLVNKLHFNPEGFALGIRVVF